MRIIGVLVGGCKKKHASGSAKGLSTFCGLVFAVAVAVLCPLSATAAQEGSSTLATPGSAGSGAVIGANPATGDRVMKTPDPKPKEESQGPQTIIVAPEVYPGGQGGGQRPPRPPRPR